MGTNGDFWGLNFMGTTGKTIDVIPQSPKVVIGPNMGPESHLSYMKYSFCTSEN